MGLQRFYASPHDTFTWPNGAIGHRSGYAMDCLGPYAKVRNCPIAGTLIRRTVYATGYADTAFSIPAVCQVRGKTIRGVLMLSSHDEGIRFTARASEYEAKLGPEAEAFKTQQAIEKGRV